MISNKFQHACKKILESLKVKCSWLPMQKIRQKKHNTMLQIKGYSQNINLIHDCTEIVQPFTWMGCV